MHVLQRRFTIEQMTRRDDIEELGKHSDSGRERKRGSHGLDLADKLLLLAGTTPTTWSSLFLSLYQCSLLFSPAHGVAWWWGSSVGSATEGMVVRGELDSHQDVRLFKGGPRTAHASLYGRALSTTFDHEVSWHPFLYLLHKQTFVNILYVITCEVFHTNFNLLLKNINAVLRFQR